MVVVVVVVVVVDVVVVAVVVVVDVVVVVSPERAALDDAHALKSNSPTRSRRAPIGR